MVINFVIHGKPFAKQRPKFTKAGHAYTPDSTVIYENLVRTCFSQKYPEHVPLTCPVRMTIRACYPVAESWSRKKKTQALAGELRPAKPDWDNVGKIVSDALNQIAYTDDALVYDCEVIKEYDTVPRVEVRIEWEEVKI